MNELTFQEIKVIFRAKDKPATWWELVEVLKNKNYELVEVIKDVDGRGVLSIEET